MADQTAQSDEVVTQGDREAAAELIGSCGLPWSGDMIRSGKSDDHGYVQAFARHRLASTAALRAEVTEWLCEPCDTIHPEPDRSRNPLECACPKCGSFMRPTTAMSRALQASLDEARAENARLRNLLRNIASDAEREGSRCCFEDADLGDRQDEYGNWWEDYMEVSKHHILAALKETASEAEPKPASCPSSLTGRCIVDTSMESGPNNCFHCERPMR